MKYQNRLLLLVVLVCLAAVFTTSCNRNRADVSAKTGARYNEEGGLQINRKIRESAGPGLIAIEGGSFVMGGSLNEDITYAHDNLKRRVTVASFYIDETEVSNVDWLEYLHWIAQKFPNDPKVYYDALPDSLVWRHPLSYNEPYVNLYLRHPSFQDYPVVGVTWEQANAYCQWRTDRVNEVILQKRGLIGSGGTEQGGSTPFNTDLYLNGQIEGSGERVRMEDGVLKQPYRLPTEAEWEYAALGLIGNTNMGNIESARTYPWNGLGVRSAKRRSQGQMLANFKIGSGNNMGIAGDLNDGGDITVPVKSYPPNDFGLYNMAGNVNEWVSDVYRQLSFEDFEDFNPYRGHEFTNLKYEDAETRTLAKDEYGRPIRVPSQAPRKQSWEELQASRNQDTPSAAYKHDVRGFDDPEMAELFGKTTLVNDKSRVYKGGSWNDRAYWLNPSTRRHAQQNEASAMIGFRCAMTMVGSAF